MKRLFFLLILLSLASLIFADERVKSYADRDSSGTLLDGSDWDQNDTWTTVDTSGSASVWFIINSSNHVTKEYTGFSSVTMWFDTTLTLGHDFVATLDTVDIVVYGLKWDFVSEQYEEANHPASGDTFQIATDYRWNGGSYTSNKFQLSKVLNFRTGWDAIKVEVSQNLTSMACRFRARLDVAEDR